MTYKSFKILSSYLYSELDKASNALKPFPKLSNGLTPDSVKALPHWREARKKYNETFKAIRELNKEGRKLGYLKRMAEERRKDRFNNQ